jgi:hypothetical protein
VATDGPIANPWLIAVLVALATLMEILDTNIVNVALRYIARGPVRRRGGGAMGRDDLPRRQPHHFGG